MLEFGAREVKYAWCVPTMFSPNVRIIDQKKFIRLHAAARYRSCSGWE
jgi:hypothetical protein